MSAGTYPPWTHKPPGLVFLDETGTPNYLRPKALAQYDAAAAAGRNPSFPVIFGLGAVLFRRQEYRRFSQAFKQVKVAHLGADVPMHEFDLRKGEPPFDVLLDPTSWQAFYDDMKTLFRDHEFGIIVVIIHKPEMQKKYDFPAAPFHPYHYSLENVVERTAMESKHFAPSWRIVAEDREQGLNEDLQEQMARLQVDGCGRGITDVRPKILAEEVRRKFDPRIWFRKKLENDSGLQIADLAVGPVVRHVYGLDKRERRSVRSLVLSKLCRARDGTVRGYGVKCFPDYPACCPLK